MQSSDVAMSGLPFGMSLNELTVPLTTVRIGDGVPISTHKQMRKRDADDFYETDPACLRAYFCSYRPSLDASVILDPGAGTGVYGQVLRELYPDCWLHGVEYNQDRFAQHPVYNRWTYVDYLEWEHEPMFHAVLANPPYKHAETFFHKSRSFLRHGTGTIDFLLRLGFAESERRYTSMWTAGFKPTRITILNTRPSFTNDGKTYPAAFAFFRWDFVDGVCQERGQIDFLRYERTPPCE